MQATKRTSRTVLAIVAIIALIALTACQAPPAGPTHVVIDNAGDFGGGGEPAGAAGDTNFTNVVTSGNLTVGGTLTVAGGVTGTNVLTTGNQDVGGIKTFTRSILLEGLTANNFEAYLAAADVTADITVTIPITGGTMVLSTLAANGPGAANSVSASTNALNWEGATKNGFETSLSVTDPTADNAIVLPNAAGTVMLSALATNAPDIANSVTGGSNALNFEGSTGANTFQTTISATDPTADRSVVLADGGGTVMLSSLATNATDAANAVTGASNALVLEGATANGFETSVSPTDPTADRTITLPDATGTVALTAEGGYWFPMTADAVVQVGDLVMPDAGTTSRFDANTGSATMPIGVLAGNGPSVQGTTGYPIVFAGLARCAMKEDVAAVFAERLIVSSTAGKCDDSANITTIGLNVGRALESQPVSNVINNTGCTGGAGCINTALDTPNTGPAGQITLSADVAALGWAVGDPVIYWNSGGTAPTGMTDGKVYFLISVSTVNVTISATRGGAVVVPSTQGDDPTQYLQKLPLMAMNIQ